MKNVWKSGATQSPPSPSAYMEGYPTEGSSTSGTDATVPGAYWYHMITQEIQNAILGGEIKPDASILNQLDLSIKAQLKVLGQSLQEQIQAVAKQQESFLTGMIQPFAVAVNNDRWILCNGQAISRSAQSRLFSVIGTRFGAGNGSSTFNVPNLVGRVIYGANGNEGVIVQEAGLPNITGSFSGRNFGHDASIRADGAFRGENSGDQGADGKHGGIRFTFDASRSNGYYGRTSKPYVEGLKLPVYIHV